MREVSSLHRVEPPRRAERMSFGAGAAVIERPGDGVIRLELSGSVGIELGDIVLAAMARALKKLDRFSLFLDLESLDDYPPSFRPRAVEFIQRDPARLIAVHGLAGTKIAAMALTVSNLTLDGKVQTHPDRLSFELALRDAARGAARVPAA
jgi:hypothetical protein